MDNSLFNYAKEFGKHIGMDSSIIERAMAKDPFTGLQESLTSKYTQLLPYAAIKIGIKSEELQRRSNGIQLNTPETHNTVNGWLETNGENFKIFINSHLMVFFWHMAKLWATRIGVMGVPGSPTEDSKFSFNETVNFTNKLMIAFYENKIFETEIVPTLHLTQKQVIFAGKICSCGEVFAVAHEFGHIIIKFFRSCISDILSYTKSISSFIISPLLKKYPDWPRDAEEEELVQKWSEEYAADLIGMNLALEICKNDIERIYTFWAAEITYITYSMLEQFVYSKKHGGIYPLVDHPFSTSRLTVIRSAADKSTRADILEVGKSLEKFSIDILKSLGIKNLMDGGNSGLANPQTIIRKY